MNCNRIYLDYNASTPIDPRTLQVMVKVLEEDFGNPSSIHFHGQKARQRLEKSRQTIADYLGVKPEEIFFTSGGTESAHLLLNGIMLRKPQGHLISSTVEHACIYETAKELEKKGYAATFLNPGEWGAIKPDAVREAIRPDTRLITLMAVNNETGVKTDWEAISEIAESYHIPFVVDGVALLGKESFQIPKGVSAAFFSGHKIHASKGIGFCFCRQAVKLIPIFMGGSQEYHRRAGTENLSAIAGLAEAVKILAEDQASITCHLKNMRDLLEGSLLKNLPNVIINGLGPRVVNTSNISFDGIDGETLLMKLDLERISVSHGSACSSGALEPSRILLNMNIPLKQARSAIRFSVGRTTSQCEIEQAVSLIRKIINNLLK